MSSEGRRRIAVVLSWGLLFAIAAAGWTRETPGIPQIAASQLPREAQETLELVRQGGPFPYAKDGSVFGNRERLLPLRERGYYREYTVRTPGARDRGARRIVAGGCGASARTGAAPARKGPGPHFVAPCAGGEYYYSEDHYASFRRIRE